MTEPRDIRPDQLTTMQQQIAERHAMAKVAATAIVDSRGTNEAVNLIAMVLLLDSLDDVPVLLRALQAARLRAANLTAAGRATLAADRDGEPDPLYYLRDQLDHDQDDAPDAAVNR